MQAVTMKAQFIYLITVISIAVANSDLEDVFKKSNDQFTAKMFHEVSSSFEGQSVVMSALSVLQPLAQLSLAAEGASRRELLEAVGLPDINATKQVFPQVYGRLKSLKGVTINLASRIYVPQNHKLKEDFALASKNVFESEVKSLDFSKNVEAAKEINTWVECETNHRIKDLVQPDSLSSDTKAVLVNAIYFKGTWDEKFEESLTSDREFHVTDDKKLKIPFMFIHTGLLYAESTKLNAKLLELPYEGKESSFLIVLPNDIEGINDLKEKLKNPALLQEARKSMYNTGVKAFIPKFKIETTIDLQNVLKKVGVKKVFDPLNAKLNNLIEGENNLYVNKAIQKAFIEINEEGSEAAAANAFHEIAYSSVIYDKEEKFDADHPFLFFLMLQNNIAFNGVFYGK